MLTCRWPADEQRNGPKVTGLAPWARLRRLKIPPGNCTVRAGGAAGGGRPPEPRALRRLPRPLAPLPAEADVQPGPVLRVPAGRQRGQCRCKVTPGLPFFALRMLPSARLAPGSSLCPLPPGDLTAQRDPHLCQPCPPRASRPSAGPGGLSAVPGDPFRSSASTLGQGCGDREVMAGLSVPQAALRPGSAGAARRMAAGG